MFRVFENKYMTYKNQSNLIQQSKVTLFFSFAGLFKFHHSGSLQEGPPCLDRSHEAEAPW